MSVSTLTSVYLGKILEMSYYDSLELLRFPVEHRIAKACSLNELI